VGTEAWYAVHVRSNQERRVALQLASLGTEIFLPTYLAPSTRTDRKVVLSKPLFGGYLFVHLDPGGPARVEVIRAPGVARIVSFGGRAVPIGDGVIESIRIMTGDGGQHARPHPLVRSGRRVRVVSGAFSGAEGILHLDGGRKARLVVEIEFLGRAVSVPVLESDVEPIFG